MATRRQPDDVKNDIKDRVDLLGGKTQVLVKEPDQPANNMYFDGYFKTPWTFDIARWNKYTDPEGGYMLLQMETQGLKYSQEAIDVLINAGMLKRELEHVNCALVNYEDPYFITFIAAGFAPTREYTLWCIEKWEDVMRDARDKGDQGKADQYAAKAQWMQAYGPAQMGPKILKGFLQGLSAVAAAVAIATGVGSIVAPGLIAASTALGATSVIAKLADSNLVKTVTATADQLIKPIENTYNTIKQTTDQMSILNTLVKPEQIKTVQSITDVVNGINKALNTAPAPVKTVNTTQPVTAQKPQAQQTQPAKTTPMAMSFDWKKYAKWGAYILIPLFVIYLLVTKVFRKNKYTNKWF